MPRPVGNLFSSRFVRGSLLPYLLASLFLSSCSPYSRRDPSTLTFLIEFNPTNLDPRFATDAQSQHIDGLLFSSLLQRDDQMNLRGDLAETWEVPDPLTYVFHLRHGVRFHDGRLLTSADVKATFEYILDPAQHSPKRGAFRMVSSIEVPDPATVIFRINAPYASFTTSLVRPAVGIVARNAGPDLAQHPIGTGPFRFVAQAQDDFVLIERNSTYFGVAAQQPRIRFRVVPDAIVRALELRKGSADLEMSSLSPDMVPVLAGRPDLAVTDRPGVNLSYLGINFQDPVLARLQVRQALAYATDRKSLIRYLLHGQATLADTILPPNHWAYEPNVTHYPYDPQRAEQLLDSAGFPRGQSAAAGLNSKGVHDGIRLHLTLKTSTEEQARLIGATLQEQWRHVGIALELRPLEIATLFSDISKGNFQLFYLRWVGANNDPDFFEFAFSSKRFPPDGANRGRYRNPQMDALTERIRMEMDREKRKALCSEAQKILANDLPYLPLWLPDVVSVHRRSLGDLPLSATGDFDFLATLPGPSTSASVPD